jgi:hypothetical protein
MPSRVYIATCRAILNRDEGIAPTTVTKIVQLKVRYRSVCLRQFTAHQLLFYPFWPDFSVIAQRRNLRLESGSKRLLFSVIVLRFRKEHD